MKDTVYIAKYRKKMNKYQVKSISAQIEVKGLRVVL